MSYPHPDHIRIYMASYSVDRYPTIHQVLAQTAQSFQDDCPILHKHLALSIYLIDSSDMPRASIYALAKAMAVSFPHIGSLNLWFERRCEIVSFLLTFNDCNRT